MLNIINDIKQKVVVMKLKKLCFCPTYFTGCEMYRLLNYETLPKLTSYIKKGRVQYDSKVLFGTKSVSSNQQFLYILNKYIIFVRDNFHIHTNEVTAIIEETLKNPYSDILFSKVDFNKGENSQVYRQEFKRMFLNNLFENYKVFLNNKTSNKQLTNIKGMSLDKEEDLENLFAFFSKIISSKASNLYYYFVKLDYNNCSDYEKSFYQAKWNTLLVNYIK